MLMQNPEDIKRFALAGRAVLTLSSTKTDTRYTYKIAAPKDDESIARPVRFVSLLTGPDNENDYQYLGMLNGTNFRLTKKSRLPAESAPVRAMTFFCFRVLSHPEAALPDGLEVRHEGRCGRCNRPLTVPESVDRGIGPDCWEKMA